VRREDSRDGTWVTTDFLSYWAAETCLAFIFASTLHHGEGFLLGTKAYHGKGQARGKASHEE
jgi:hypothetical protein